jgi:hypothetical protein
MFRFAQYALRVSHKVIQRPFLCSSEIDNNRKYSKVHHLHDYFSKILEHIYPMVIKRSINGMNRYQVIFYKRQTSVNRHVFITIRIIVSCCCFSLQGELLIDVEDKLNRKRYVSSLDIEIVCYCRAMSF